MMEDDVLVILSAQPSDSGTYTCEAKDDIDIWSFSANLVVNCELGFRVYKSFHIPEQHIALLALVMAPYLENGIHT